MDVFRFLAEQRIQEAIDAGAFDKIEGMGRPLNLEQGLGIPPEMRAAFKLLQDAGLRPREVDLMREIARLKGAIDRSPTREQQHALEQELGRLQTELDVMLGRTVPCGCSRSLAKKRRHCGL